jgi:hypothetical protein
VVKAKVEFSIHKIPPPGTILTKSSESRITKYFANDVSDGVGFAGKENFVVNAFNVVF